MWFFFSNSCSIMWIEGTSTYLRKVKDMKNESFSSSDFHWGQYDQDNVLKHRPVLQERFIVYQTNDTLIEAMPIYTSVNNAFEKVSLWDRQNYYRLLAITPFVQQFHNAVLGCCSTHSQARPVAHHHQRPHSSLTPLLAPALVLSRALREQVQLTNPAEPSSSGGSVNWTNL